MTGQVFFFSVINNVNTNTIELKMISFFQHNTKMRIHDNPLCLSCESIYYLKNKAYCHHDVWVSHYLFSIHAVSLYEERIILY